MDQVYTVSQVNQYIKNMFVRENELNNIAMKGEISNCKYHTSGHIYFTVKDRTSQMACVMFAGQRKGLSFVMKDGQSVVVLGNINVYERDGKYQLYANEIMLDGSGYLFEKFEKLKKDLFEEGLFDNQFKKKIPEFVTTVGIVTASTGAAIQDIINISERRNPYVQLVLYPTKVQGEGAAKSIAQGIRYLDQQDLDVIIVGRGGGSIEDLFAFNEEIVARAIFACKTPIISAVGHETDTTIADFVADMRAPTPSAAAELAIYNIQEVSIHLSSLEKTLQQWMMRKVSQYRMRMQHLQKQVEYASPMQKIRQRRQYCIDTEEKLSLLMQRRLRKDRHRFEIYVEKLKGLSPLVKLSGGYSYVTNEQGDSVRSINQVIVGNIIQITVTDGTVTARVEKKQSEKVRITDAKATNKTNTRTVL